MQLQVLQRVHLDADVLQDAQATDTFEVGKLEWDGTWPIWQTRVSGDATGDTTPRDVLWTSGSSGGAYACGVLTQGGVDYAYITKFKP